MKSSLTDHPHRSILLLLGLAVAPAVAMFVISLIAQVIAYQVYHNLSLPASFERVTAHLASMSESGGWLGAAYICFNNIGNFGILATLSVLALERYGRRRVRCFYLVAAAVLLIFGLFFPSPMHRGLIHYISLGPHWSPHWDDLPWFLLWVKYPAYALPAALLAGAAAAMLPMFRESGLAIVKQGNCPNCRYDLRKETTQGCPECGWNRQGPHAGREEPRLVERAALLRKRAWLIGGWSAVVLIVAGANLTQLISMMPRVTYRTHTMALTHPHSQAYDAVEIALDIRAVSGWFEFPGKVSRGKWAATFSYDNPQYQQWFNARMQTPAQMLAPPPRYTSITTFDADSLAGRATYRCGDDVQVDMLDLQTLVHWMRMLFPDADPTRLLDEAEGILALVEADLQWARDGVTSDAMRLPISTSAFRGYGGSSRGVPPQRLWYPGVAIVAGVVLAVWLYGAWVLVRWTKPKA